LPYNVGWVFCRPHRKSESRSTRRQIYEAQEKVSADYFSFWQEAAVIRERALKIVLVLVGLIFLALVYPLKVFLAQDPSMSMMFSLYVTLGIFLLAAVRDPSAHRSLIAFTAWSSIVHGVVMGAQAYMGMVQRIELVGSVVLIVIGAALIALAPAKRSGELSSAAAA
jgi:hypothetical protein